jgi:branched-chain amino acid transport system substrate-binding protein
MNSWQGAVAGAAALCGIGLCGAGLAQVPAAAEKRYGPGASDTQIRIGNMMPYSGPDPVYGVVGRAETAFFKMINDEDGINGRKIDFISYDDGGDPLNTIEQALRLVEDDGVLLIFNSLGTSTNTAIEPYM